MTRWVLFALVAALAGCKNDLEELSLIDVQAGAPDRVTYKAEYLYSDSGKVQNRLRAGRVDEFMAEGDERTLMSEGVELAFFDAKGNGGSLLTARRGSIIPKEKRMVVEEQVVFTNARGERLETEQLIWSQDSDRVWTNRPVKITRAQDIIYGQGLDANEDFSRYTIRKITGTLFVDPADTATSTPQH